MEKTAFRTAHISETDLVCDCYKRVISAMQTEGLDQWDEYYPSAGMIAEDVAAGQMYLLTRNETIIAACVINNDQDREYADAVWTCCAPDIAVFHRFCVNPAYAQTGIGKLMLAMCEAQAQKTCAAVRLDAFSENARALRFYESAGYIKRGETHFRKGKFYLYEKTFVI